MRKSRLSRRVAALLAAIMVGGLSLNLTAFAEETPPEPPASAAEETLTLPYLNTDLSFEERAADLVSRMTPEEKNAQLRARTAPAIDRLGVRRYDWWSEALHGVARDGKATSFPTGLGIASTWDTDLVEQMMSATSDEAREKFNVQDNAHGLSYWSPTINLARDPRWGRGEENYGEDPFLTAQIGNSFIDGLQGTGEDEKYLKAIATAKHFAANNSESNRHTGTADFDDRTLREYYTYAFKSAVEDANVESIMTSYNRVNGVPMSVNTYMLDDLLRRTWGFDGYVVTDCDTINDIYKGHSWKPDDWPSDKPFGAKESVAYALKAGVDLNCGSHFPDNAKPAIDAELMSEDDVDVALVRLFTSRMKTGEFDPADMVPYSNLENYGRGKQLLAADHTALAEKSADEAVVMLKNESLEGANTPFLPLKGNEINNLVIVGDLADECILGDYSTYEPSNTSTPIQGITAALKRANEAATVTYVPGGKSSGSFNYLMNVRAPEMLDENGNVVRKFDLTKNSELSGCEIEGSGENANIGYNGDGDWVKFDVIDFSQTKKLRVKMAGDVNAGPTTMEVRLGSPSGQLVGSTNAGKGNTGGWTSWEEYTFEFTGAGGGYDNEQHNVYLVFKNTPKDDVGFTEEEKTAIKNADAVIAYIGTKEGEMGAAEESDRTSLGFPREEEAMVNNLAALNPKTAVYIQSVGQMNLDKFAESVPSIMWCTYNGQAQGNAAGRLLFGEANPSAKLPFTWYTDVSQLGSVKDYTIRSGNGSNGRTYQYFTGDVTYPFGHGLSYSDFSYSNLSLDSDTVSPDDTLTVSFDVTNTSAVDGKEVAEVYVVSPGADKVNRPAKRLKGFEKVEIAAGDTESISIDIPVSDLYYWDQENMVQTFDQGSYTIQVGGSSADAESTTANFTLSGSLSVEATTITATPTGHILSVEKPSKTIATKTSVTNNDETFVTLGEGDVTYTSSNEKVAKVDTKGIVSPVGGGVATITASYGGLTATYPVVVNQTVGADDILLDGKSLKGFTPEILEYTVQITDMSTFPAVTATAREDFKIDIVQATTETPKATVTVSSEEISTTYTLHFIKPPKSIDFTTATREELLADWDIIREDASNWSIGENGLVLTTLKGDLYANSNNAKNIFTQDAAGDWTMDSKVVFAHKPEGNYQQASIMAYQDDDNYLKLSYEYATPKTLIQFGWEIGGSFSNAFKVEYEGTELFYRLTKKGDVYTAYYSTDGVEYKEMGQKTADLKAVKLGLIAINGEKDITPQDVAFKYMNITQDNPCSCILYDLKSEENTSFGPVTKDEAAAHQLTAAVKVRGACDLEGHASTEPVFTYALKPGGINTAEATVENDQLTAQKVGRADVRVTATLNNAKPVTLDVSYYASGAITTAVKGSDAKITTDPVDQAAAGDLVTVKIPEAESEKVFKSITVAKGTGEESIPVLTKEITEGREYTFNMPNQPVTVSVLFTADKTDLNSVIKTANAKAQAAYTEESWAEFAAALATALEVAEDDDATNQQVTDAKKSLEEKMDALEVKSDLDVLNALLVSMGDALTAQADHLYTDETAENERPNGTYSKTAYDKMTSAKSDADALVEEIGSNKQENTEKPDNELPPVDEGITPPVDEGTTPPTDEGTTPPTDEGTTPPTDEGTTPPTDEGTIPPADEETAPPADTTISLTEKTTIMVLSAYVTAEETPQEETTQDDQTKLPENGAELDDRDTRANPPDITEDQKVRVAQMVETVTAALESFNGTKVTVDTTDLKTAIEAAQALLEENYTAESWQVLTDAIKAATDLIETGTYTAKQTAEAKEAIVAASDDLTSMFSITLTQTSGGTIVSNPESVIIEGGSVTFTVTSNEGYALSEFVVNDETRALNTENKFVLENVMADVTATAVFKRVANTPSGGIELEPGEGTTIPDDVVLEVVEKPAGETEKISIPDAKAKLAFDISLDQDGADYQPDGTVSVTIKLPAELQRIIDKLEIYYMNGTTPVAMHATATADGSLRFNTTHFSTYVVAEKVERKSPSGGGSSSGGNRDTETAWDKIVTNIDRADDGETVKVCISVGERIPRAVIEAIAGKNITLVISDGKTSATLYGLDVEQPSKARIYYLLSTLKDLETERETEPTPPANLPVDTTDMPDTPYNPSTGGWIEVPAIQEQPPVLSEITPEVPDIANKAVEPQTPAPVASPDVTANAETQTAQTSAFPWIAVAGLLLAAGAGGFVYYKKRQSETD